MQWRAWLFSMLGVVFLLTGVLGYEIFKPTYEPEYVFSFEPMMPASQAFEALYGNWERVLEAFDKYWQLEKLRLYGIGLALIAFALAWRNSVAWTHYRYHQEIMALLSGQHPSQQPKTQTYRSRFET